MEKGGTQNHGRKYMESNDDAQGLIAERWYSQSLCYQKRKEKVESLGCVGTMVQELEIYGQKTDKNNLL